MKFKLNVENIKCGGCVNSIKTRLMKIDGVKTVSVDIENQTVNIEGGDNPELFVSALASMGYPIFGENDIVNKVKSYVSCAIGSINS